MLFRPFLLVVFLLVLFGGGTHVFAQSGAGVGIRPAIVDDRMDAGETKEFTLTISNLSSVDQLFYLYRRDIVGASDNGTPEFAPPDRELSGLELSQWITLEQESVFVPAGGSEQIRYSLRAPDEISPGSHFGGIFVSVEPPEMQESGAAVGYEVANIITIRISGIAEESAFIREFSTARFFYGSANVDFQSRIENTGNTLVRPRGLVTVTNMFGKEVASLPFNESLGGVFPGTTRSFALSWASDTVGLGRYEALLALSYGDTGAVKSLHSSITFWILPMNIILPALGTLLFILLIMYVSVRIYVQRQISRYAQIGTRKIVRQRSNGPSLITILLLSTLTVTSIFLVILLLLFA